MIIARRTLTFAADPPVPVEIRIFAPQREHDGAWFCRFEIDWPDGSADKTGWGFDAVQAIQLTMQRIGIELYCSEYHETGLLYFEKPGSGYGFPVPNNARGMLVGDDARFDG